MDSSRIPQVKSTINHTSQVNTGGNSVGHMSQYGVRPPLASLREGDVVRAEITDLRNNEITIVLEDNTSIKGHLAGSSSLSIGQTASFRLAHVSPRGIVLETLKGQYTSSQLAVIRQALEEAGLPDNEKNEEVVRELMNHKMPINKQAISLILNQSYQTGSNDVGSLVLMNKHHLPISQEMVQQFSDYRSYEHQLIQKIDTLAEDLPALLRALAGNGPKDAVASFGHSLLSLISLPENGSQQGTPNLSFLSYEERESLINILEKEGELSQTETAALKSGDASVPDILSLLDKDVTDSEEVVNAKDTNQPSATGAENAPEAGGKSLPSSKDASEEETEEAGKPGNLSNLLKLGKNFAQNAKSSLDTLLSQMTETSGFSKDYLIGRLEEHLQNLDSDRLLSGSLLSDAQKEELLHAIEELPISNILKSRIQAGTANAEEILQTIKNVIPLSDSEAIRSLFQTDAFQNLYKAVLVKQFTLTPADFKNSKTVQEFYPRMEKALSSLENLIHSQLSGDASEEFSSQSKNMQDNIAFMKSLNQMFTCMQLPLKLSEQTAHGDLYVYTKKEALRQAPDKIRVLLHLDLANLGTLNVHITKDGRQVDTKFYTQDKGVLALLNTNGSLLSESLAQAGYQSHVTAEVMKEEEEKPDIVKDFMEADLSHSDMTRYTFDLRA